LKALHLAHLRLDLTVDDRMQARLVQAADEAKALGCTLELALLLSSDPETDLQKLVPVIDAVKPPIARWLVFRAGEHGIDRTTVELARRYLEPYGALIGAGTDAFFTQLNRNRPPIEIMDWVVYSLNPQVHAFDNVSLIETLAVQAFTVESARHFANECRIAVSPITLKMRWNPDATAPDPATPPGVLPKTVDVRQMSLFGAVWTLGSIKSLALSSADSLTYYETTGWLGVMERERGPRLPDKFPSLEGSVFPLYHVFADVNEFAGGEVFPASSAQPLAFDALAMRKDGLLSVLVANYTPQPQTVTLTGITGAFAYRSLDETSADFALRDPEAFRSQPGLPVHADADSLHLDLLPYAVVRLDQRR
jgi:D-apionolactonase